ncbi:MAG: hypothetical protein H6619_03335 [Deltaproteobacteria bacterium]|nr:hypothetical protein [Deltaproteobacteria bacterium]
MKKILPIILLSLSIPSIVCAQDWGSAAENATEAFFDNTVGLIPVVGGAISDNVGGVVGGVVGLAGGLANEIVDTATLKQNPGKLLGDCLCLTGDAVADIGPHFGVVTTVGGAAAGFVLNKAGNAINWCCSEDESKAVVQLAEISMQEAEEEEEDQPKGPTTPGSGGGGGKKKFYHSECEDPIADLTGGPACIANAACKCPLSTGVSIWGYCQNDCSCDCDEWKAAVDPSTIPPEVTPPADDGPSGPGTPGGGDTTGGGGDGSTLVDDGELPEDEGNGSGAGSGIACYLIVKEKITEDIFVYEEDINSCSSSATCICEKDGAAIESPALCTSCQCNCPDGYSPVPASEAGQYAQNLG